MTVQVRTGEIAGIPPWRGDSRPAASARGHGQLRFDPRFNTRLWDEPAAYVAAYSQGLGIANSEDPFTNPYARQDGRITALADVQARFYARGVYRH